MLNSGGGIWLYTRVNFDSDANENSIKLVAYQPYTGPLL